MTGDIRGGDEFVFQAKTDPIPVPGTAGIQLEGSITQTTSGLDWDLSAQVFDWAPLPNVSADMLTITLGSDGVELDAVVDVADLNDVRLSGDFHFQTDTFRIASDVPLDWEPVENVEINEVYFALSNRDPDGSKGALRAEAKGDLTLFDTNFEVAASISGAGTWFSATPETTWAFLEQLEEKGLDLENPQLIVSNYDLVLDVETMQELPDTQLLEGSLRQIGRGVNFVAGGQLPDEIPQIGGSDVQVSGVIGTSLSSMQLEAKIVLERAWVVADVISFETLGLRITGQPSLTVFGQGRVLHSEIPGLEQDIAVEAGLGLTPTTLSGSLSLIEPVYDAFQTEGLDIIEADISVGITFCSSDTHRGIQLSR